MRIITGFTCKKTHFEKQSKMPKVTHIPRADPTSESGGHHSKHVLLPDGAGRAGQPSCRHTAMAIAVPRTHLTLRAGRAFGKEPRAPSCCGLRGGCQRVSDAGKPQPPPRRVLDRQCGIKGMLGDALAFACSPDGLAGGTFHIQ